MMAEKNNPKDAALTAIAAINRVEGFDPLPLAVDYTDLNTGEARKRLPVMAQMAWFRLKYPEGRIAISVAPCNDCFVATAKVYKNCQDPPECYLAEATAARTFQPDRPTVSPREWAQTAAVGIALRNAGFGLQFHAAGDSFDQPAADELGAIPTAAPPAAPHKVETMPDIEDIPNNGPPKPMPVPPFEEPTLEEFAASVSADTQAVAAPVMQVADAAPVVPAAPVVAATSPEPPAPQMPEEMSVEAAMQVGCPITKYAGRTLGEMIALDPKALVWIANKYSGDEKVSEAARLLCQEAMSSLQEPA